MKSLLFLKQSLGEAGNSAPSFISSDIDLGSFSNAVYKHNENLKLSVGLEFDHHKDKVKFEVDSSGKFSFIEISGDALEVMSDAAKREGKSLAFTARFTRNLANNYNISFPTKRDLKNFSLGTLMGNRALSEAVLTAGGTKFKGKNITISASSNEPAVIEYMNNIDAMEFRFSNSRFIRVRNSELTRTKSEHELFQSYAIERIINRTLESTKGFLSNISHLGGLRAIPDRYEIIGNTSNALGSDASNIANFLSNKSKLVRETSNWLTKFTEGTYGLELVKLERDRRFHTDLNALILVDKKSKITTSFRDVGIGLSQVLPIITRLVQLSAPSKKLNSQLNKLYKLGLGGVMFRNPLLLIEQPELHLHPKMQLQLADLFAVASAATNDGGPQVIVETHSENLILRVQKLVREGKLSKDAVSVVFIDRDKRSGKSQVKELPLATNGEFLAAWPDDFSELRLEEIL